MYNPFPNAGTPCGEIVSWDIRGEGVSQIDLVNGLKDSNLDPDVARELLTRNAFSRACKKLCESRVIRKLSEDETTIYFQFTRESKEYGEFNYSKEAVISVNKETAKVSGDNFALVEQAQAELDRAFGVRTSADVTRIIQKLFEANADLFPIRRRGGAYFVPQTFVEFVGNIDKFITRVNGIFSRWPIFAGTGPGDKSVRNAVANGISEVINEHREAIEKLHKGCHKKSLSKCAEQISATRFKVEAYAAYLEDEKAKLELALDEAQEELRAKLEAIAAEKEAEESGESETEATPEADSVSDEQPALIGD